MDDVDLSEVFTCRASVMQSVLRFLWGSFRVALKVVLDEIFTGYESHSVLPQRGWKLLLLLHRMFCTDLVGEVLSREKLVARFDKCAAGHWHNLIIRGSDRVPSESEEI